LERRPPSWVAVRTLEAEKNLKTRSHRLDSLSRITMSSDNYGGLARVCVFFLIIELFFAPELPRALHLVLTWGLSGALLLAVLRRTESEDDRRERTHRRNWGMGLLLIPIVLSLIGLALPFPWGNVFAGAAGGALVTPGLVPGLVLLLFAIPMRRRKQTTSFTKPVRRQSATQREPQDQSKDL
jgi:hypothetical protein